MGLFSEGLIIGGNFAFQNWMGLTIKTANPNSPWAYVWEGLLSEEYLRLRFGVPIFGRAYFRNFTEERIDPDVNANFSRPKKTPLDR